MTVQKEGITVDSYQVVLDVITKSEKPVKAGEVVAATGLDKREVDKAMAKLKKEGKISSPKACYWEISK